MNRPQCDGAGHFSKPADAPYATHDGAPSPPLVGIGPDAVFEAQGQIGGEKGCVRAGGFGASEDRWTSWQAVPAFAVAGELQPLLLAMPISLLATCDFNG